MNNRQGFQGFNEGMGFFNNLMGNFADTMRGMGDTSTNSARNIGERLGDWGQQMGAWGQNMSGVFSDANPNRRSNQNQRRNQEQYTRQNSDPTQNPNFNPFDHLNQGRNQQSQGFNHFFSNDNRNPDFSFQQESQTNYGPYNVPPQNHNRQSQRQQQQNNEQRHRHRNNQNNRDNTRHSDDEPMRPNRKVRLPPQEPDKALFNEAKAHIRVSEIDQAITKLLKAMEISDQSKYSQLLGYCYLKKGDFNLGIALFKEMLNNDPNNSKLHRHIGICYMEKAKLASSMDLINTGVEHFYSAYEITNSDLNYRNYLAAKKLRFLAISETEQLRKTAFLESIKKYEIENIDAYLQKTYLEQNVSLPEHFKCAITLVN